MRKEGINPLTNDGQYADTTYKRAVEKRNRENFFMLFVVGLLDELMQN